MNSRIFLAFSASVFFSLFLTIAIQAQNDPYQRTFPSDERSIFSICNSATSGGGYYLVGIFDDGTGIGLTASKHDPKGTLVWGADYLIEDTGYAVGFKSIECETIAGDTLVIAALNAANSDEKMIIVCEPREGKVAWSSSIRNSDEIIQPSVSGFVHVENDINNDINYFSSHNLEGLSGVHFEKIGNDQTSKVTRSYYSLDEDTLASNLVYFDATITQDTGSLVVAGVDDGSSAVLKLDSDGNVLSARKYMLHDTLFGTLQLNAIAETPDKGFVATGLSQDIADVLRIHLLKADSLGNIEWSNEINMFSLPFLVLNQSIDLTVTNNGEILVAGKFLDFASGGVADYTIFYDLMGTAQRQYFYGGGFSFWIDTNIGLQLNLNDLSHTRDGNILMSTTGIDFEFLRFVPVVAKMDQMGDALCQDTLPINATFDFPLFQDTLMIADTLMAVREALDVEYRLFDAYSVPVVNLQDTLFCPQDPIIYTMDATTEGAIGYEWSTGDTTARVTVMEEGEYSVIVTMAERICYTLCDTATISQQDFPEAILNFRDQFCESREHQLSVGSTTDGDGGAIWSPGGETTPSILVPAVPGTVYSVTITDSCNNTAEESYTLPENPTQTTTILIDNGQLCDNGVIILNAESDSEFAPFEYLWSNNSTGSGLEVTEPGGTFSVTLTDACDLVDSFTVTIPASDFEIPEPSVSITELDIVVSRCGKQLVADGVAGASNLEIISYEWNTDDTTQEIYITDTGTYIVTVTDNCGQIATAEITITEPIVIPDPSIDINDPSLDYTNCGIALSATAMAVDDGSISSILWSDGSSASSIFIDMPGTYTVTVTDNCGNTDEDEVIIPADDLNFPNPGIEIMLMEGDSCSNQLYVEIDENHPIAIQSYLWSTSETNDSIAPSGEGNYMVTVTDICGGEAVANFAFTTNIEYPNLFFPGSNNHVENRSFGPYIGCEIAVENYKFEIFNRWGKRVFQTEEITERWSGRLDNSGSILEEDVYLWQITYTNSVGEEIKEKGHVTLATLRQ